MRKEDAILESIRDRKGLPEPKINLMKMLRENKTEAFLKPCFMRIAEQNLINGKYIDVELTTPHNLLLSPEGISLAEDILESYVDKDNLQKYKQELIFACMEIETVNNLAACLRSMDRITLNAIYSGAIDCPFTDMEKVMFKSFVEEEIKARKLSERIKRNLRRLRENTRIIWKYRRFILFGITHPKSG